MVKCGLQGLAFWHNGMKQMPANFGCAFHLLDYGNLSSVLVDLAADKGDGARNHSKIKRTPKRGFRRFPMRL